MRRNPLREKLSDSFQPNPRPKSPQNVTDFILSP